MPLARARNRLNANHRPRLERDAHVFSLGINAESAEADPPGGNVKSHGFLGPGARPGTKGDGNGDRDAWAAAALDRRFGTGAVDIGIRLQVDRYQAGIVR